MLSVWLPWMPRLLRMLLLWSRPLLAVDIKRVWSRLWRRYGARYSPPLRQSGPALPIARLPLLAKDAAQSLVDRVMIGSAKYRAKAVLDQTGLHPDMVKFSNRFLEELLKRGIPLYVHEGYRPPQAQLALLKRGVTRAGPGQSAHNWGKAVDIIHLTKGWDLTTKQWAVVGLIGKECARKCNIAIDWGGDFPSFYDPAHWQLRDWRKVK